MKKSPLFLLLAVGGALLAVAGCGSINTSPEGDPNRVISGRVNFNSELVLPPDAVVVVRLLDPAATGQKRSAVNKDLPVMAGPAVDTMAQVLGEQTIKSPAPGPVPFRIEYRADDRLLRHGLNLEARISYGGRVRMRTVNARAVTLGNATDPHEVSVQSVAR